MELKSTNPKDPLLIHPNYFTQKEDLDLVIESMKLSRKIFAAENIKNQVKIFDMSKIFGHPIDSDEYLHEYIRRFITTVYHPVLIIIEKNKTDE